MKELSANRAAAELKDATLDCSQSSKQPDVKATAAVEGQETPMFDKTADQSDVAIESRKRSDLFFPLVFSASAVVVTVVWLAAIGWLVWQPIGYLAALLFE